MLFRPNTVRVSHYRYRGHHIPTPWATRSGPTTAGRARSLHGRPRAATTGTPFMLTLPQGPGAVDGHDRHHHHAGVGQDLGGLVRLAVHRAQGGASG